MKIDPKILEIIREHKQVDENSCIPSVVELILKIEGKVPLDYEKQQIQWRHRDNGNFEEYHDYVIEGVKFTRRFGAYERGPNFPLSELYAQIDDELSFGRFVAIAIPSHPGFHVWIIYSKNDQNDYNAFAKHYYKTETEFISNVKEKIEEIDTEGNNKHGADILTYTMLP